MNTKKLLTVIELPGFSNYSSLFAKLHIQEKQVNSPRQAIHALKKFKPDVILADFLYGYSNNYAGINICNLDVLMYSLPKYAPAAEVLIMVEQSEVAYAEKFASMFPLRGMLVRPFTSQQLEVALRQ